MYKWDCRKWNVSYALHPKAWYEECSVSTISAYFFLFFISQKVAAYVLKRVPGYSVGSIEFIFEVGVLKKLFDLRTIKKAVIYLGLTCAWKFLP
jgi:hypothetical protein